MIGWILAGAGVVVLAAVSYRPLRRLYHEIEFERARERFVLQRELQEAKFLDLARSAGKPKGLRWEQCEFDSSVRFVRDKSTGELSAFVEVTIRFSAVEGGGMENVEAVADLRNATAVFHYHRGRWGTGGRVLFNLTPFQAIARLRAQYEEVVG